MSKSHQNFVYYYNNKFFHISSSVAWINGSDSTCSENIGAQDRTNTYLMSLFKSLKYYACLFESSPQHIHLQGVVSQGSTILQRSYAFKDDGPADNLQLIPVIFLTGTSHVFCFYTFYKFKTLLWFRFCWAGHGHCDSTFTTLEQQASSPLNGDRKACFIYAWLCFYLRTNLITISSNLYKWLWCNS